MATEPGSATTRRSVVLAVALVGALILGGVALGVSRLEGGPERVARADGVDTDGDRDGLTDVVERSGVVTKPGDKYATDAKDADTDDDGLTDGEEVGARDADSGSKPLYRGISDPLRPDSDDDGVDDGDEYFLGTDPWSQDSDADGLPDEEEIESGADPVVDNADGDSYSDQEERDRGSAPMVYDESGWQATAATALTALKMTLTVAASSAGADWRQRRRQSRLPRPPLWLPR